MVDYALAIKDLHVCSCKHDIHGALDGFIAASPIRDGRLRVGHQIPPCLLVRARHPWRHLMALSQHLPSEMVDYALAIKYLHVCSCKHGIHGALDGFIAASPIRDGRLRVGHQIPPCLFVQARHPWRYLMALSRKKCSAGSLAEHFGKVCLF